MKNVLRGMALTWLHICFLFAGCMIVACMDQSTADVPRQQVSRIMQNDKTFGSSDKNLGKPEHQRNDLTKEWLDEWDEYEIVSETSFRVFFISGTHDCYGYRAAMEETEKEIRVAVISGLIPRRPPACTLEAGFSHFLLKTKKPIAGRKIVPLGQVELKNS